MKLSCGEEKVIVQGMRPEECWWGPYQFPMTYNLGDRLVVSVHVEEDDIYNQGVSARWFESRDEGGTWQEIDESVAAECGLLLKNGDRLYIPPESGVKLEGYEFEHPHYLTPDYDFNKKSEAGKFPIPDGFMFFFGGTMIRAYRAERLPAPFDKKEWSVERIPAGSNEVVHEKTQLDWPYLTRTVMFDRADSKTGTLKSIFPRGNLKYGPDGAIWVSGFSGEGHLNPENGQYCPYYSAEIFRSEDNGRTFERRAHMEYPADGSTKYSYQSGGFSDSDFEFMPDGSIVWFLRSTWMASTGYEWAPMYMSRSTDMGHSWTKPEIAADCGVFPRLCTLECGVTLICYARPGIFVKACLNNSGTEWSEPLCILKPGDRSGLANEKIEKPIWHQWDGECGNPQIVSLGQNTALLVYGDFYYPDENGVKRKTILCRKITVEL